MNIGSSPNWVIARALPLRHKAIAGLGPKAGMLCVQKACNRFSSARKEHHTISITTDGAAAAGKA